MVPLERQTRFLSLDKCLKGRDFMQVITVEVDPAYADDCDLYYDPLWLAIVKESHHYVSSSTNRVMLPAHLTVSQETLDFVKAVVEEGGGDMQRWEE